MTSVSVAGASFWARPGLGALLAGLDADGEEARVVGGAVRNTLLGRPVTDVDIATTALPAEVGARARAAGLKAVPTGIDHGTVTVVADHHHAYEVTTLREDTETDGRRAVVRFGRSWVHDAARRDFTMNALYATRAGEVVDLVGGLDDLAARRVRFIGDAGMRIREDYLRILRLFRFHAAYGVGAVDPGALTAAVRLRAGLAGLSRERVRAELMKLVLASGAVPTLATMSEAGLLQPLIAGIGDHAAFARLVALEAQWGVPPAAVRRLAALAVRVADDVARLKEKLRLSNAEVRRLDALFSPPAAAVEGRCVAGGEVAGDEVVGQGAAGQDVVNRDVVNRDVVNRDVVNRDVVNRDVVDQDVVDQDVVDQDVVGQDVVGQDMEAAARACVYRLGAETARDRALWQTARGRLATARARILIATAEHWVAPKPPITAADLMARGVKPGPALGAALARAEQGWVDAGFPVDPARIAAIIAAALR